VEVRQPHDVDLFRLLDHAGQPNAVVAQRRDTGRPPEADQLGLDTALRKTAVDGAAPRAQIHRPVLAGTDELAQRTHVHRSFDRPGCSGMAVDYRYGSGVRTPDYRRASLDPVSLCDAKAERKTP
jgi:hypothetical protein